MPLLLKAGIIFMQNYGAVGLKFETFRDATAVNIVNMECKILKVLKN